VELAHAGLSREPELELLDRAHIQRVLEEQKMSVSGIVEASQAFAVGKLLTVDLIAVVEMSPGTAGVPGLVIFDSRTGVRYWNAALPVIETELERAADAVVVAVRTAHRKREGRTPAFHTVGVMTVRNADLPRSQDGLCEAMGLLVERGLSRSPDLAVLERRRLAHVNEERSLPVVEPPKDLLASLTTVDLEISRAADGRGLRAIALLKAAGKEKPEIVTVTVPEMNAMLLTETLLQKLIEALHAAPAATAADPRLERAIITAINAGAMRSVRRKRLGLSIRRMKILANAFACIWFALRPICSGQRDSTSSLSAAHEPGWTRVSKTRCSKCC
jgi:hypothetical protein